MKIVEKRDGKTERDVLIGMIVHPSVIAAIAPKWEGKEGLFKSRWANVVGKWAVDFYNKYGKPPAKAVEGLYEAWAKRADEDQVKLIGKFLEALSGEYVRRKKDINPQYLIDRAGEHFTTVKLGRLRDQIDGGISTGKLDDVLKEVDRFGKVDVGEGATMDLLQDLNDWKDSLTDIDADVLIRYPGALGKFYKDAFSRDSFVAFLGPEKRGKTMAMMDVAWTAMLQRRKVMFFEIGDMSKKQILRRFGARAAMHPVRSGPVKIPVKIYKEDDRYQVKFKTVDYKTGLDFAKVKQALDRVMLEQVRSKKPYFKLEVYPNNSIGMAGIKASVQRQERLGWVPDVVVIDYADLLAPPPGYTESRDQINASWKAMRALSQEYHCCLVTATQANAASYKSDSLDMSNFSEDKRKFAHVTGMVGLNQSDDEKDINLIRYNWLVLREDGYSVRNFVNVVGCPELAAPALLSRL